MTVEGLKQTDYKLVFQDAIMFLPNGEVVTGIKPMDIDRETVLLVNKKEVNSDGNFILNGMPPL